MGPPLDPGSYTLPTPPSVEPDMQRLEGLIYQFFWACPKKWGHSYNNLHIDVASGYLTSINGPFIDDLAINFFKRLIVHSCM